jgi:hypothetical protein
MKGLAGFRLVVAMLLGSALAPALGSAQGRGRTVLRAPSYFPLQAGSTWSYERKGVVATGTWQARVAPPGDSPKPESHSRLEGYFTGPARNVRTDALGVVSERAERSPDTLWYLFGAPVGFPWELHLQDIPDGGGGAACVDGARLRIAARDETVSVPAGEFTNVIRVEHHGACADAGITAEWFAPGVGLIRREETSFAGPVVSELVRAEIGDVVYPRAAYTTSLSLGSAVLVNNLMPPVSADGLPVVRGALTVRNDTDAAVELAFSGCRSVAVEVLDAKGGVVVTARGDDGGCCSCKSLIQETLARASLAVPFSFVLRTAKGEALPDGRYALHATLETQGPSALRPAGVALIEVRSVH